MSAMKKAFDALSNPAVPVVDPYLAAPIIHGGDYGTFDKIMTGLFENLMETHKGMHGDEYEVRPALRANEPQMTIKAEWGEFWKNPKMASKIAAMELIDEINSLKKPRN